MPKVWLRTMLRSAAVAGLLTSPALADDAAAGDGPRDSAEKWQPWFELGGRVSGQRSLGEGNLFIPLTQSHDTLVFADLRGMFDDQDAREGNIGLGVRRMLPSGWNLGGYGYFDVRRSSMGNRFYQVVVGGEALSETFDLRGNLYLPVGSRERRMDLPATTATTVESSFNPANLSIETAQWTTTTDGFVTEKALSGFDAEAGFRLPVFDLASGLDLRVFGGAYYFDAPGVGAVRGPRGRLEFSAQALDGYLGRLLPGLRLTTGVTLQRDSARGEQTIAYARLRLPLQEPPASVRPLTYMERRMTEAVVRDVDIVSNSRTEITTTEPVLSVETEPAVNPSNGAEVTSVVQVDATEGQAALQTALDDAGEGGIVIANGDFSVTTATNLDVGRILLGGSSVLPLQGAESGVEVGFTAPGAPGSLSGTFGSGDSYMVRMARDSWLGGMTVSNTNSSTYGVVLENADNAIVSNSEIDVARSGIDIRSGDGISLSGNTVTSGAAGVQAQHGSVSNLYIYNNTINSRYSSIYVSGGPSVVSATISENIMSASGGPQYGAIDILPGPTRTVLPGSDGNEYVGSTGVHCASRSGFDGVVRFTDGESC